MPLAFLDWREATIRLSGQFEIGLSLPDRGAGSSRKSRYILIPPLRSTGYHSLWPPSRPVLAELVTTPVARHNEVWAIDVDAYVVRPGPVSSTASSCSAVDRRAGRSRYQGDDGAYVNFFGPHDGDRIEAAYPGETLARLRRTKATYDPTNRFRNESGHR